MRNLKKVIALVAVFAMLVSTVAFAQTYSDVAETDAYAEAIETLSMLGILTGDDADNDGKMDFRPADTITRAEVAAIVCRIQAMNSAAQTSTPFTDVPSSHWASGYVNQAAGQGIVNGYGDGKFGPDDNVTYEQVIKMLMETLGYNLFAADNGGYPTGYLTAAQRYGVLDGVIGGGSGTEANRGMVAQMVYNAIDTPLMDKYYYGKDATYMIYDGQTTGVSYMTLMSRDLKIVKGSGTVTANSYTDGIDLDKEKTIVLSVDGSDVNYWYLGTKDKYTFKQGDVDADALLGYAVNIYAKKNVNGSYTLLSATKDSAKNEEVSYPVDSFKKLDGNKVIFDKEDGSEASVTVAKNATVIFNGVKVESGLADIFGVAGGIVKDNKYNGAVTFVDTKDTTGKDVVKVDIATTAVVDRLAPNGALYFLNDVKVPQLNKERKFAGTKLLPYLKIDKDATNVIINLTKDGEAIDFTELKKWDVLSVTNLDNVKLYNASVLGEANYVDGYVTATRTNGEFKLSDGNWYEADANGYKTKGLESGDAGRFYIDAYGTVVALDDKVTVEGVETAIGDNYALVLDAETQEVQFVGDTVVAQVLDKSGEIYNAYLASRVTLKNLNVVNDTLAGTLAGSDDKTDFSYDMTKIGNNADDLADAMIGRMISYTADSNNAIKAITFEQGDDEEDMFRGKSNLSTAQKYDADEKEIDGVAIADDTYVFYMTNSISAGTAAYGDKDHKATAEYSKVGKGADLVEGTYKYVAFDTGSDDVAKAIIIMNTTGEIANANHVAVINSIGKTVVDGAKAYIVEYWMNGELKEAVALEEVNALTGVDFANAVKGDVYKMNVTNGKITAAKQIMGYNEREAGEVAATDVALSDPDSNDGNGTIFGAITAISDSGKITLSSGKTISGKDAQAANVYVLDPNVAKAENQLYASAIGEAYVNTDITDAIAKGAISLKVDYEDSDSADKTIAADSIDDIYELCDYAFAYVYDDDVIDIVVYKAYAYDYTK